MKNIMLTLLVLCLFAGLAGCALNQMERPTEIHPGHVGHEIH